ncbi:MAG: M23 family metallopeptidase [Gemmatimonadota bacterium]|nr:M23 family metallopeptidase [Gemmatimonadota bacterium]
MRGRRWAVVVVRDGATAARRLHVSERRLALSLVAILLVGTTGLIGLGRWTVRRSVPEKVASLEQELDSLRAENARIALLAARLAELETSYGRLREVMGGELEPSARDILLPDIRTDGKTVSGRPVGRAGPTVWPLVEAGFITRTFGDTVPGEGVHVGLDIAVPVGSYVRSTGTGVVSEAGEDREYGWFVRVEHEGGLTALYAHNSWTFVLAGDSVEAGEVIALSGNTGRSTAPHLHLEIERDGVSVDPLPFVAGRL